MDRTRVAAWIAGIAGILIALVFFYELRDATLDEPAALASALFSVGFPFVIAWTLAMPESALARTALPATQALAMAFSAWSLWSFFGREFPGSDAPWQLYVGIFLPVPVLVCSALWAARPTRWPTLALQVALAVQAGISLVGTWQMLFLFADPLPTTRLVHAVLVLVPSVALIVGLRPVAPPPTTL